MIVRLAAALLGLSAAAGLSACGSLSSAPAAVLAPLPPGWPKTLALGVASPRGGGAGDAPFGPLPFRYQYLSGGVNTGRDWLHWGHGDGSFAAEYVERVRAAGGMPVLTYYQLLQSAPTEAVEALEPERVESPSVEAARDLANLRSRSVMRPYFANLGRLLRSLAGRKPVVLHIEPDLWGYAQAEAGDEAASVPASVAATGMPPLRGLPDNLSGFAGAIVRLRNRFAPNVLLGYHLSPWGTGKDIHLSHPDRAEVGRMASSSIAFYRSLKAPFDLLFSEFANRDAGYEEAVAGDGGVAWWGPADFRHFAEYLGEVARGVDRRIVLWQIPVGNTVMRPLDNGPGHYQDNRAQWLLGRGSRPHLSEYARAGVIALLFGSPHADGTCACDARGDGITNPAPISGNTGWARSADDDGGYLRARAWAYTRAPLRLPAGGRR